MPPLCRHLPLYSAFAALPSSRRGCARAGLLGQVAAASSESNRRLRELEAESNANQIDAETQRAALLATREKMRAEQVVQSAAAAAAAKWNVAEAQQSAAEAVERAEAAAAVRWGQREQSERAAWKADMQLSASKCELLTAELDARKQEWAKATTREVIRKAEHAQVGLAASDARASLKEAEIKARGLSIALALEETARFAAEEALAAKVEELQVEEARVEEAVRRAAAEQAGATEHAAEAVKKVAGLRLQLEVARSSADAAARAAAMQAAQVAATAQAKLDEELAQAEEAAEAAAEALRVEKEVEVARLHGLVEAGDQRSTALTKAVAAEQVWGGSCSHSHVAAAPLLLHHRLEYDC